MKSFAIIAAFIAGALAAPATTLSIRETSGPQITEIAYRVSNLEDPAKPKSVETTLKVNGGEVIFDRDSVLVGACETCLNTEGFVYATRVDILTPLEAVHCNLYNGEKHVIAELSNLVQGADFDGIETEATNKAINADQYSLMCYYV